MSINSRQIQDAELAASIALANATTTTNSAAIDLGSATPYPVTEAFAAKISTTVGTGANNKNITITVEHSDEPNANFAAISELATLVIAEVDAEYAATERTVQLPPATKRYVRLSTVGEVAGGNAADGAATLALLF